MTVPTGHRYEHDQDRDWLALERFAVAASPSGSEVNADDFMCMGAAEFADGRVIHSYKHVGTRRYLHLDLAGHSYRYLSTADGGRYVAWPEPRQAIDHALDRGISR